MGFQGENINAHKIRQFQKAAGHQDMLAHSKGAKAEFIAAWYDSNFERNLKDEI